MPDKLDPIIRCGQALKNLPTAVLAAIVDDHDLQARDAVALEGQDPVDAGGHQVALVVDRDQHAQGQGMRAALLRGGQRREQLRRARAIGGGGFGDG